MKKILLLIFISITYSQNYNLDNCETKIPIWENPKYCPNCLEEKHK